jgi:signal transduction histidine kinase
MNKVASSFTIVGQDVSPARTEIIPRLSTGVHPALSEENVHELRQPLGVIDSLAYYLELTASDDKMNAHLGQIRAMVSQANRILEGVTNKRPEIAAGNPFLSRAPKS